MRRKSHEINLQPLVSVVSGKGLRSHTRTCGVDKREKVRDDFRNNKVLARSVCKTPSHCYFKLSREHSFWALGFQTRIQSVKRLGREKDLCISEQAILLETNLRESWDFPPLFYPEPEMKIHFLTLISFQTSFQAFYLKKHTFWRRYWSLFSMHLQ